MRSVIIIVHCFQRESRDKFSFLFRLANTPQHNITLFTVPAKRHRSTVSIRQSIAFNVFSPLLCRMKRIQNGCADTAFFHIPSFVLFNGYRLVDVRSSTMIGTFVVHNKSTGFSCIHCETFHPEKRV